MRLDKARALLLSITAEHEADSKSGDHKWARCRVCLAREVLDHGPEASLLIRELLAEFDRLTEEKGESQ